MKITEARRRTVVVWSYRVRAICWAIVGAISFPLGWSSSVALVWCASVYANVLTDWSGGAAADDRAVLDELCQARAENAQILTALAQLTEEVRRGHQ